MQTKIIMDQNIWYLIGKRLSGEATEDEWAELDRILSANPYMQYYMEELSKWWQLAEQVGAEGSEQAFLDHLKRMERIIWGSTLHHDE